MSGIIFDLGNIGDLAKPVTTFIEKVSAGIGVCYSPWHITRTAKADAKAELIRAESEIKKKALQQRALNRFAAEETRKQINIEGIAKKAIPLIKNTAHPENMDNDWIANFFDKCKFISDKEVQAIWSRILAGEANLPGSFSKRTLGVLESLDKSDAKLFMNLCSFCWFMGDITPLIYDWNAEIYNKLQINFTTIQRLQELGLITTSELGFKKSRVPNEGTIFYHGLYITLDLSKSRGNELATGKVLLTGAGQQLAPICGSESTNGFLEYVLERWRAKENILVYSPWPRKSPGV